MAINNSKVTHFERQGKKQGVIIFLDVLFNLFYPVQTLAELIS